MKLIFLHGPPASGKYSIAQKLQEHWGVLNFHNHLTLDVAKSLFTFGTTEFWDLTHRLRCVALGAKAQDLGANVVFTNCYSNPHDDSNVEEIENILTVKGGEFLPVYLKCGIEELRRRVVEQSRVSMRKLSTVEDLEQFLSQWNCVALNRPNCFEVSTDRKSIDECVNEITQRLSLRRLL